MSLCLYNTHSMHEPPVQHARYTLSQITNPRLVLICISLIIGDAQVFCGCFMFHVSVGYLCCFLWEMSLHAALLRLRIFVVVLFSIIYFVRFLNLMFIFNVLSLLWKFVHLIYFHYVHPQHPGETTHTLQVLRFNPVSPLSADTCVHWVITMKWCPGWLLCCKIRNVKGKQWWTNHSILVGILLIL